MPEPGCSDRPTITLRRRWRFENAAKGPRFTSADWAKGHPRRGGGPLRRCAPAWQVFS